MYGNVNNVCVCVFANIEIAETGTAIFKLFN